MLLLFANVVAIVVGCLELWGGVRCDKSINSLPEPVPGPTANADSNERLASLSLVIRVFRVQGCLRFRV